MDQIEHSAACIYVRWMIRRDLTSVLEIESSCFEFPWSEDEFIRCLRQRNCIGMVAEDDGRVVGFMIYELHRTRLHVLNFAVHPDARRRGIGRAMIQKLTTKLSADRRTRITLEVRETNLDAQKFFRSMSFRAIALLRDFYEDTTEDAYLMQYRYSAVASTSQYPINRLGRLAG
jgi:ribosomal-protein-alanine N-acetyltransferase